jgi:hypothetical protein
MRSVSFGSRIVVVAIAMLPAIAAAQPTVDGTADALYGPALAVQNTQTNFGNSNLGVVDFANGSELDQGYGIIHSGNLYLMLAGNVESNFNKLEVFIDSVAGGQNKLQGDNPDVDFNGLNRMGDDGSGNGLTFDAAFASDYYLTATGGNSPYQFFANFAETSGPGGTGMFLGGGDGTSITGALGINLAINNSNTGGVDGGTGPSSGAGVLTGVEICIPLTAIGNPTGPIKVSAFINGGGHDFLANQVLGGIGGGDNLGEPRNVNFANIPGDQYFTIVPEPGSMILLGMGGLALIRRRR